jgi:hypothetical protein
VAGLLVKPLGVVDEFPFGTVALSVCKIEAGLTGEAVDPSSPLSGVKTASLRLAWVDPGAPSWPRTGSWLCRYTCSTSCSAESPNG